MKQSATPDHVSISADEKFTVLKVIAYSGILLNITQLFQYGSMGVRFFQLRQHIAPLMTWRYLAMEGVTLLAHVMWLAGSVGLAYRQRSGRTLIARATVAWSVLLILLSYWLPVLLMLPVNALILGLLYNRSNSGFLDHRPAVRRYSRRESACFRCLAASCVFHFWALMAIVYPHDAWLWKIIPHGRPINLLELAAVLLIAGTLLAPPKRRAWHAGVTLMTFCVAIGIQLVTNMSTSTHLFQFLPAPKAYVPIPWGVLLPYSTLIGIVSLGLLARARQPEQSNGRTQ